VLCNYDHQRRVRYQADVFLARVADHPDAVVLTDVRIAWDMPSLKAHGSDMMVIFGLQIIRNWSTFDVAVEGVRPTLIVEVTSLETCVLDLEVKMAHYALAGVPLYVIAGAHEQRSEALVRALGYELAGATYRRQVPNEQVWLWLEPLRVWIGAEGREVYCFDEQRRIGDYATLTTIVIESEEQVAAAWAAAKAEARARMEAEVRAREESAVRREAEQARREAEARAAPKRACTRSSRNCAGCAARGTGP
jgi:hypothetical protein